jgi:hypothetical protein
VGWWRRTWAWRPWRPLAEPPPPEERTWVHPSELPSFTSLATKRAQLRSRAARAVATAMVIGLVAGASGLASIRGTPMVNDAMNAQPAVALADLPANARAAAERTVDLTIAVPGHVTTVAAMALPDGLAVTTAPIPDGALLRGSVPGHLNFAVTWVGRDTVLGFSIVRLGRRVPALSFDPLPANAPVLAVAPVVTSVSTPVRFLYARTSLGDPTRRADGVISYLATRPTPNLDAVTDALALDARGRVVAVLSANGYWFDAGFVARVAEIVAMGHGCHSSLGVKGYSAQGGGALVTSVARRGPANAQLRAGDIVLRVGGRDIDSWQTLETVLYLTPAGSTVTVDFLRGTHDGHAEVILACSL